MNNTYLGGCYQLEEDFKQNLDCCSSCHYDEEEGFGSLCEIYVDNGYYAVCCIAATAFKEPEKENK